MLCARVLKVEKLSGNFRFTAPWTENPWTELTAMKPSQIIYTPVVYFPSRRLVQYILRLQYVWRHWTPGLHSNKRQGVRKVSEHLNIYFEWIQISTPKLLQYFYCFQERWKRLSPFWKAGKEGSFNIFYSNSYIVALHRKGIFTHYPYNNVT